MAINYAAFGGIRSLPAAIVFAVLYLPLAAWYLRTLLHILRRYVIVLTAFCIIRIISFTIRAILAGNTSAAQNLSIYIAEQVLLSVGFFALLFSAYTLVLDRTDVLYQYYLGGGRQRYDYPFNMIMGLIQNRHLFRIVMLAALVLGIVGSSVSDPHTSQSLKNSSVVIFLVLTVVTTLNTLTVLYLEFVNPGAHYPSHAPFGSKYGSVVLLVISLLLLIREIFITVTLNNTAVYLNEHFWYPLVALPEFLVVALYLTPGLFPEAQSDQVPKDPMMQ